MKMKENHKKREDLIQSAQTDVINVVTPFIEKDLDVQQQSTNIKFVRRLTTSVDYATRRLKKVIIIKGPCSQAHQLKVGSVQTQSLYDQSDDYSSEDSFCLKLKVKPQCDEAETKFTAPRHLVTNLEIKLKPHKKRTKFLRARRDICANVNLMLISVYKLLYKDPDCVKIAPSSKSGISTYTTEKIPVLGFCDLFIVHPDTRCLKEVIFQVVNHEGSVIISCVTSLDLELIQTHSELNASIPDYGRLIFSSADHPNKYQNKKIESSSSVSNNM